MKIKLSNPVKMSCILVFMGLGLRPNKGQSIHFRLPDFVFNNRMETVMACKKNNKAAPAAKAAPSVKKATCKRKTACATKSCELPTTAPKKKVSKKEPVVLTVQADVGSKVFLAGSFNNWDPTGIEMKDKDGNGVYTVAINLDPGIYEYKFVINGTWTLDPDPDRDWTQNGLGTLNSVLRV